MFFKNLENIETLDMTDSELYPILSVLDVGILVVNVKGEIIFYNPKHAQMDNMKSEDVLGRKILDVYRLDESSSLVMRSLKTKRPIVECPMIYKTHHGQIVDSITNVIPLTKKGKFAGVISFIKDYQTVDDTNDGEKDKVIQLNFIGDTDFCMDDIIGSSVLLLESVSRARMAARTDSPVLIYGETGTGKELFAQSIHNLSSRHKARYIAVNCAAIPENLLEGILFGTSKGAFTGALDKAGLLERANGGTLFLDEMNSMSQEMQPKLLRALQEKRVCRIGSDREIRLDVKIISSINTNLDQTLLSGEVRRDLLYRLSVVYISLPPLKAREGDLPVLIDFFLEKYNKLLHKNVSGISSEVQRLFEYHDWPGNVRELENVIEGALNMVGREPTIEKWHLTSGFELFVKKRDGYNEKGDSEEGQSLLKRSIRREKTATSRPVSTPTTEVGDVHEEIETRKILEALSDADGNISDAAVIMGISRQTFYRRIKDLKIEVPKKSGSQQRQLIVQHLEQYDGNKARTARALGISRQLLTYRMKKMGIQ